MPQTNSLEELAIAQFGEGAQRGRDQIGAGGPRWNDRADRGPSASARCTLWMIRQNPMDGISSVKFAPSCSAGSAPTAPQKVLSTHLACAFTLPRFQANSTFPVFNSVLRSGPVALPHLR